ncbi:hypothetical protein AXG93_1992s1030 [Marchantia polymorpha subsp. ruderalis]|uniref:Uncharacterized protein n=1 Tax=Marchantia polymorpha subsp. ruderalis TaxID=1480154 RepID=A0A176VJ35_MARPO|nr:hypothetical protein AXG93_1992s1030 [Marchantia polymorpha subsp. ruderalis]
MAEEFRKHEGEFTIWVKKLTDCESARSSEVGSRLKVKSKRRPLQEQLRKAIMRLKESQRRTEKGEATYRHLRDETTNELRLRVEKCLRGFTWLGADVSLDDDVTATSDGTASESSSPDG